MERRKLLIAEGAEDFRVALADALRGAYHVRQCSDGREALEQMRKFLPDIVVLDMMLPGLDGITILEMATSAGLRPVVLATTRYLSDYVLEAAERFQVGYLMMKPCDVRAAVARISDLSQRIRQPMITQPNPRNHVSNLLLALGVATKLKGYSYLREAILLMAKDPAQSVTKELYPAVGALCNADADNVERSCRSAIVSAWNNRDDQLWQLYFAADGSGMLKRPTNATFISRLADTLRMEAYSIENP